MKIQNVFYPIKNSIKTISRKIFTNSSESMSELSNSGLEMLGNQNRLLIKAENQIEPLKNDFKSTKELFEYAKSRCIEGLKSETPYEHSVIVDTKQNRVIAEYKGDNKHCSMVNIENFVKNPDYTIIFHGHPSGYPLSSTDIHFLLNHNVNQIVAINEAGEFSLVAKNIKRPDERSFKKVKRRFDDEVMGYASDFYSCDHSNLYMGLIHYNLEKHAEGMGLRYLTNYSYLKKGKLN